MAGFTRAGATLAAQLRSPERVRQLVALAVRVASAALGYAILAGAARVTGLADFGDFALVMAVAAMFGAVATLGQETLLLRRLPLLCAGGGAGYRRAVRRSGVLVGASLAVSAVVAMAYGRHSFTTGGAGLLVLTGLLVFTSGAAELLFAIGRGSGSVLGAVVRRELVWKLVLLAAIAGLMAMRARVGAAVLAGWYLAGTATVVVLSLGYVARVWRRMPRADAAAPVAGEEAPREHAFSFFLLNLIAQAGTQLDILVLGLMTGVPAVQLGAYYAAQRTIQVLYILPYGASITSAPRIPLAFAAGDTAEIVRLSRQISREVAGVVAVLVLLAWLFRGPVMAVFRPEFVPFAMLLPVLALGPLASVLGGLHNMVAPMCGMEKPYAHWRLAIILVFLGLKLAAAATHLLMPFAWVSAAEAAGIAIAGVVMARRRLGVWIV